MDLPVEAQLGQIDDEKLGKDGSDIIAATDKCFANLEGSVKKNKSERVGWPF